ncbi:MAG TPA: hypothetical protein DDZ41_09655 [Flavobacterium sp.]|nr:hypothetical protein [Flavobacterium sp.]
MCSINTNQLNIIGLAIIDTQNFNLTPTKRIRNFRTRGLCAPRLIVWMWFASLVVLEKEILFRIRSCWMKYPYYLDSVGFDKIL